MDMYAVYNTHMSIFRSCRRFPCKGILRPKLKARNGAAFSRLRTT